VTLSGRCFNTKRQHLWIDGMVSRKGHDESGAVLILALVFLLTVGMVIFSLLEFAGGIALPVRARPRAEP